MGTKRAGEKYLSKFYRQKLRLPVGDREAFTLSCLKKINLGSEANDWDPERPRSQHLANLIGRTEISLREIKKISEFSTTLSILSEWLKAAWPITNALLVLRSHSPSAYKEILLTGKTSGLDFLVSSGNWAEIDSALKVLLQSETLDQDAIARGPNKEIFVSLLKDLGSYHAGPAVWRRKLHFAEHLESSGSILR